MGEQRVDPHPNVPSMPWPDVTSSALRRRAEHTNGESPGASRVAPAAAASPGLSADSRFSSCSPLLSLKTIRVEGASKVSAASVRTALGGQLGRPLALIDFDSITRKLGNFPLIRSFVTETVPPGTLIIRIAERTPIATLATSSGFSVVDPAGIVIDSSADRQPSLPLIELGSATKSSPAFVAAVGVLLALPSALLKQVDTVTAQTSDDVTLTLTGGQSVVWGSAEQSALKAKVLAAVIAVGGATTKYDLSAPNHPVLGGT